MPFQDRAHREIADDLRAQICLSAADAPPVFHEASIARQYGLSRTPIREILQALSAEGLVETRAGVGTIATRLDPAERPRAFRVYAALILAGADCLGDRPVPDEVKIELSGLANLAAMETRHSAEGFVTICRGLTHALAVTVDDQIFSSAMRAAHWRVLRWRTLDFRDDPEANWARMTGNLQLAARSLGDGTVADLLRTVAGVTQSFLDVQRDGAPRRLEPQGAGLGG